jgi:SAM-dependent methyltransferase
MIESLEEYQKMAAVEERLWWYRTLHALVIEQLKGRFSPDAGILDAGCGSGGLLLALKSAGFCNLRAFDLSKIAVEFTRKRGFAVEQLDLRDCGRHYQAEQFDVICSNDTLCYFRPEELPPVMEGLSAGLKSGGLLILNLPAFEAFSGIHDLAVGIVHRFNKQDLRNLGGTQGLELDRVIFWPFFLSPVIFAARAMQRLKLRLGRAKIESDVNPIPHFLDRSFYALTEVERRLYRQVPWGSSAFVVFRKRTVNS